MMHDCTTSQQGDTKPTRSPANKPTTAHMTKAVHQVLQSQDMSTFSIAQLMQQLGAWVGSHCSYIPKLLH